MDHSGTGTRTLFLLAVVIAGGGLVMETGRGGTAGEVMPASSASPAPPIDRGAPLRTETATFALG